MQPRKTRPPRTLKQRAIALLARRDYARAELAARLAASGGAREEIDALLNELERAGYISDARFASALVQHKSGAYGKRAIEQSLREKGVPPSTVKEAMAALAAIDEVATASELWRRRFGTPPGDEREKARQVRFLLSRGYSTTIAFKVLRGAGAPLEDG